MGRIVSFRDLEVWQLGMELVIHVYRATDSFPATERYGLSAQMHRAAISIPSNIAEGHARRDGAYLNHVRIALGSQAELGTEIEAATRLGFLDAGRAKILLDEIGRIRQMLHGLRRSLEARKQQQISCAVLVLLVCAAAVLG